MNENQPDNPAESTTPPTRPVTLRDRWEEVRYGRMGRVLGYVVVFTIIFVAIFLFLLMLESGHL